MKISQPVGYRSFHPDENFNFQLNRWLPYLPEAELFEAANQITDFDSWKAVMLHYAKAAEAAGNTLNSAFYYRAAEFFMAGHDQEKSKAYEKFIGQFYQWATDIPLQRVQVPYEQAYLPAIEIKPEGEAWDTLVIHGGFDSFMEELLPQFLEFVEQGVRVILFEGPGQGKVLKQLGIPMTPDWEKPVSAILDYFQLDSCSLLGISLGGFLATRAAAFEPRIHRVIADDVMEDFFGCLANRIGTTKARKLSLLLKLRLRPVVNFFLNATAQSDPLTAWAASHGMNVSGTKSPYDYLKWTQQFHTGPFSHCLTQDYLLLAARSDHLVPINQFHQQAKTLTNVRSFTGRIFSHHEHAGNHCQVGNLGKASRFMLSWLSSVQPEHKATAS